MNERRGARPQLRFGSVFARTFALWWKDVVPTCAVLAVCLLPWLTIESWPEWAPLAVFFVGWSSHAALMTSRTFSRLRGARCTVVESVTNGLRAVPGAALVGAYQFAIYVIPLLPILLDYPMRPTGSETVLLAFAFMMAGLVLAGYFVCGLGLAVPALVLERMRPSDATRSSWRRTKGIRYRVLRLAFVLYVIGLMLGVTIRFVVEAWEWYGVSGEAAGFVWAVLLGSILNVMFTVVYHDARRDHDGLYTDELGVFD